MKQAKSGEQQPQTDKKTALRPIYVELVKLQRHVIASRMKVLVIVEGRDAAGKDGTIKRLVKHLSPRETRVVAPGMPSDHDRNSWYFQRYTQHLPAAGEIVLFNRSWYNRAGVERVMGFCTDTEYKEFMQAVPQFEQVLAHCGLTILKYYLDISKDEQKKRLKARRTDPLRQWKRSPVDDEAPKYWKEYSVARNEMFARTHGIFAPWIIVRADHKPTARLNLMRDLLSRIDYQGKNHTIALPNPEMAFAYNDAYLTNGKIEK